ncbi:MAG: twin-arginine translocase TatA/TatE family subunit [Candidatus Omnitrophota bacterium]
MFGMGVQELLIILLICLLIFGANKLPEIGRAFGKTINSFKKALKEETVQDTDESGKKS